MGRSPRYDRYSSGPRIGDQVGIGIGPRTLSASGEGSLLGRQSLYPAYTCKQPIGYRANRWRELSGFDELEVDA